MNRARMTHGVIRFALGSRLLAGRIHVEVETTSFGVWEGVRSGTGVPLVSLAARKDLTR